MTIKIKYTKDNIGVRFCAIGDVSGKDIIAGIKEILQFKNFENLKYWIVDRLLCTKYDVSSNDVRFIAELGIKGAKRNPDLLMALVSSSDLQFGVSKMYEAYSGEKGHKTKVFRNMDSAEKWIENELLIMIDRCVIEESRVK